MIVVIVALGYFSTLGSVPSPARNFKETHRLGCESSVAQSVELAGELLKEFLDLGVLLLEVLVELVDDLAPGVLLLCSRVVLLVNLGKGLVRFGVLDLHEARREERVRVNGALAHDVVEFILSCATKVRLQSDNLMVSECEETHVEDALLDEVLDRLRGLFRDDGLDLAGALVLEVLLEETVDRSIPRLGLSFRCPVLGSDVLGLELSDLGRECEEAAFVPG